MFESTVKFLRCVRCGSKLDLDIYANDTEVKEGILECKNCQLVFPIIEKIPVLWDDFSKYLTSRTILGGKMFRSATSTKMKNFLKSALTKNNSSPKFVDVTALEDRWSNIYQNSKNSKFYLKIKNNLKYLSTSKLVLEYGCSIGIMTSYLSDSHDVVFGVDKSFNALKHAKQSSDSTNLDYVVADLLSPVFGKLQFDLILALNILELVEPSELLKHVSKQISTGHLVISDPYDFDRGINSVKKPLDEYSLRKSLEKSNFKISPKTKNPSFLPWNLKINSRATLNYKVDLIIAKK